MRTVALVLVLFLCSAGISQSCGDCDGDGVVSVLDALAAARHSTGAAILTGAGFEACNVQGAPGGPAWPGTTVDILDALTLAQIAVGLPVVPTCGGALQLSIADPACGAASGDQLIALDVLPAGALIDLSFSHSSDGGISWRPCSPSGSGSISANPATGIPSGAGITFGWDTSGDGLGLAAPLLVALMVEVTGGGVWKRTAVELLVENRVGQPAFPLAETNAVGLLRQLAAAEDEFRSLGYVDANADGHGEHGWIQELAGTVPYRGAPGAVTVRQPFVPARLGASAAAGGGIAADAGYLMRMWLPGAAPPAIGETAGPPATPLPHADAQEDVFACYAWPQSIGCGTGRAFVVNQEGEVWWTPNVGAQAYEGAGGGPPPQAALAGFFSFENPANVDAWISALPARPTGDASPWSPVPGTSNEDVAIDVLSLVAAAQAAFKAGAFVDQDSDLDGEYGWLQELAAATTLRDTLGGRTLPALEWAALDRLVGERAAANGGIASIGGYLFTVYLPRASGPAVRESTPAPVFAPGDVDALEGRWICYAWPEHLSAAGRSAFAVNQQGEVWETPNQGYQDYEGLAAIPPPGAALFAGPGQDADNLEGVLDATHAGGDGQVWRPVTMTLNERIACDTLRRIAAAESAFRARAIVDDDGDSGGEYGWLQELAGATAARDAHPSTQHFPDLATALGAEAASAGGLGRRGGYRFQVWLPEGGAAVGESSPVPVFPPVSDADSRELRYAVYAWPESLDPDRLAFVVDEWGEVWRTQNLGFQDYEGTASVPPPQAAFVPSFILSSPAWLEGRFVTGIPAGDGQLWSPVPPRDPEAAAVDTLVRVARAQRAVRAGVWIDQDADGEGEFAWLQEVTGTIGRTWIPGSVADIPMFLPLLQEELGERARTGAGIALLHDHAFAFYLPRVSAGPAVPESSPLAPIVPLDAAAQEARFAAYAWPRGPAPGRAFVVDQRGEVWQTANVGVQDYSGTTPASAPPPQAAYSTWPGSLQVPANLEGMFLADRAGGDGGLWTPLARRDQEEAAIDTLRQIHAAQSAFQADCVVDVDADGVGEFGWLQELGSGIGVRVPPASRASVPLRQPFASTVLATSASAGAGIATRDGYRFRMFLPRDTGSAQAESAPPAIATAAADIDLQERRWLCYAWPVALTARTRRAFVVNQKGAVFATASDGAQGYAGATAPAAGAAFVADSLRDPVRLDGRIVSGTAASDGGVWVELTSARDEESAIATLERLIAAELAMRADAVIDQDTDGRGEFAFLQELCGVSGVRDAGGGLTALPAHPAPMSTQLGVSAAASAGIASRAGYRFETWLPTDLGPAQPEQSPFTTFTLPDDADPQEQRFAIYAWPERIRRERFRAFVISHQQEIYSTWNLGAQSYRSAVSGPSPEACFVVSGAQSPANLEGVFTMNTPGMDAFLWEPARYASEEEAAIVDLLLQIHEGQERFRADAVVDQDSDGRGEYGWLQELSGTSGTRLPGGGLSSLPAYPPYVPTMLGATAQASMGIGACRGARFQMWLPTLAGPAAGENVPLPTFGAGDADAQEERWACYAWPANIRGRVRRAFVIDPRGEVYATPNLNHQDYQGSVTLPSRGAAYVFRGAQDPENLEGIFTSQQRAEDGHWWYPVPAGAGEPGAVATLREIHAAQVAFKAARIVDQDGDGQGELGYLQELASASGVRTTLGGGLSALPLLDPFLRTALGVGMTAAAGSSYDGYRYLVYLPAELGPAIAESTPLPTFATAGDADAQEQRWICYAWPDVPRSGRARHRRAFAINQQGEVFSTRNEGVQDYGGRATVPSPEAALVAVGAQDPTNLEGALTPGVPAGDGAIWDRVP